MMNPRRSRISSETITLAVYLCLLVIIGIVFRRLIGESFLTVANFVNLFKHMSVTALVGLGLTFVIAVGYADMSFHFVSCFAGMTTGYLIACGLSPAWSVLAGCGSGAAFGAINGVMVGRFKLPDMVATLGLGAIAFGMAYLYSRGSYIFTNFRTSGIMLLNSSKPLTIPLPAALNHGQPLRVPLPVLLMVGAYAIGFLVLHCSTFGRRFYAIGSNPTAARFSGVRVGWYILAAFVICAVVASFTNMIQSAAQGNANVKGGLPLLMPGYATVFLGVSIFKKPTVIGTFLGALLIGLVQNGIMLMQKEFYTMEVVMGVLLIVAIVLSRIDFKEIIRKRRLRAEIAAGGEHA